MVPGADSAHSVHDDDQLLLDAGGRGVPPGGAGLLIPAVHQSDPHHLPHHRLGCVSVSSFSIIKAFSLSLCLFTSSQSSGELRFSSADTGNYFDPKSIHYGSLVPSGDQFDPPLSS